MAEEANGSHLNPFAKFLLGVWIFIRGYLIGVGLLVTLLPLILMFVVSQFKPSGLSNDESASEWSLSRDRPATLALRLEGELIAGRSQFGDRLLLDLFSGSELLSVKTIKDTLANAAADEKIDSLQIELGALIASPIEMTEIRRSIVQLQADGKDVEVVLYDGSNWNYFLASAAKQVTIAPATSLFIPGPTFQLTYFGTALENLGVDFEVVKAGRFKSAFEAFTQNRPSSATIEQYQAMEEALRSWTINAVAEGRNRSLVEVDRWFGQSIFTASDALEQGLVDAIGTGTRLDLSEVGDGSGKRGIPFEDYSKRPNVLASQLGSEPGGIALIEAEGEIVMHDESSPFDERGSISPVNLRRKLRWAAGEPEVKAVVLKINSPGGSAVASEELWQEVERLVAIKPVVVAMGSVAASGGYYMAAPATRIIAEPSTITGSIGVIGAVPNLAPFEEKYGVSFHLVTESARRQLLDLGQAASATDKALLEATIEQVYEVFLSRVADGRGMSVEQVGELAQGRVYTGLEAENLGLVDELGGIDDAFRAAKLLGGLNPRKKYPLLRYEDTFRDITECLRGPLQAYRCLKEGGVAVGLHGLGLSQQWLRNASRDHFSEVGLAIDSIGPVHRMIDLLRSPQTFNPLVRGFRGSATTSSIVH